MLGCGQLPYEGCGRNQARRPKSRAQTLGKAHQSDDSIAGHVDRWQTLSVESQVGIGVVFDDYEAVLACQVGQMAASVHVEHRAGGVVVMGYHIHDLARDSRSQSLGENIGSQTIAVRRNGQQTGAGSPEHLNRTEVARIVERDHVAAVQENLRDHVQPLLAAARYQHAMGID
ncbi:hypothetical protein ADL00_26640 [Streptomyces sp. AS58]|nr:hypothetical protein ADL00_26640 [Streptomyces sp. AS58]